MKRTAARFGRPKCIAASDQKADIGLARTLAAVDQTTKVVLGRTLPLFGWAEHANRRAEISLFGQA